MNTPTNNMSIKVTHAEHSEMAEPTDPAATAASPPVPAGPSGHGIGIDDHALLRMAETVPNL